MGLIVSKAGKQWLVRTWLLPLSTPWKIKVDRDWHVHGSLSVSIRKPSFPTCHSLIYTTWATSDFTVQRETPGSSGASRCCILASWRHLHCTHRKQSKVNHASLQMLPISAGDWRTVLCKPHKSFVDVCTVLCKKKYKEPAFHWLPVILLDLLLRLLIWLSQSPYLPTTSMRMSSFPSISLSKLSPSVNSVLLILDLFLSFSVF